MLKGRLPITLFRAKAKEFYSEWLNAQSEPVKEEDQLKFSQTWIYGWMKEWDVSLKKPNKRFSISQPDRIQRLTEYLFNILRVRRYYKEKFNIDIPVINGKSKSKSQ